MNYVQAFEALQRSMMDEPDEVPEGYFTTEQWSSAASKSIGQTSKTIRKAVEAGAMEMLNIRILNPSGIVRAVPHYRIKNAD